MPKILDDNALRRLIEAARGCEEVDVIERAAMREYLLERPSARNGTGLWRSARRFAARTIGGGAARGVLRGVGPLTLRGISVGSRAARDCRNPHDHLPSSEHLAARGSCTAGRTRPSAATSSRRTGRDAWRS